MKLFHLSDLHLGKRVCEQSLKEDQEDILDQIVRLAESEKPDAVMIAGDIYDRSLPSEEAVSMFDDFLYRLSLLNIRILIIGGNHDSQERVAYGGRIMKRSGIFIAPEFNKNNYGRVTEPVVLNDEFGEVSFYLLPFVTPASVRAARENTTAVSFTDAVRAVISDMNIDVSKRNILIAHQFVTGASVCESETFSVGGTDNVDASVFDGFDYVALGHLHGAQSVGRETVRYCGTPLKYSFSEVDHKKSVTLVNVGEKGEIGVSFLPLDKPLHDWKEISGTFDEVIKRANANDYIKVTLTDNDDISDAVKKLREFFPNMLQLSFGNARINSEYDAARLENVQSLSPTELFAEFYKKQRGTDLSEQQMKTVTEIFEEIRACIQ